MAGTRDFYLVTVDVLISQPGSFLRALVSEMEPGDFVCVKVQEVSRGSNKRLEPFCLG